MLRWFLPFLLLVGLVAFEAGRHTRARTAAPVSEASVSVHTPAPTRVPATACDKELAETKLKLGICLAYGSPGTTRSAEVRWNPVVEMLSHKSEHPGVRLDKPLTTEMIEPTDDHVLVQRPDGTVRFYSAGEWPPPGGPGVGSKILRRTRVDGTIEVSPLDGFPEPEGPTSMPGETEKERIGRLLRETPGAIFVQHTNGSLQVYAPAEWPPPGGLEPGAVVLGHRRGNTEGRLAPGAPEDDK